MRVAANLSIPSGHAIHLPPHFLHLIALFGGTAGAFLHPGVMLLPLKPFRHWAVQPAPHAVSDCLRALIACF